MIWLVWFWCRLVLVWSMCLAISWSTFDLGLNCVCCVWFVLIIMCMFGTASEALVTVAVSMTCCCLLGGVRVVCRVVKLTVLNRGIILVLMLSSTVVMWWTLFLFGRKIRTALLGPVCALVLVWVIRCVVLGMRCVFVGSGWLS